MFWFRYFAKTIFTKSNQLCKCATTPKNGLLIQSTRNFCESSSDKPKALRSKYKNFEDNSEIVSDIYEEHEEQYGYNLPDAEDTEPLDIYEGLNLNRGIQGVFDIEDLVDVLKRENGQDILVAKMSKDIQYADYICITSAKSARHMQALVQFVRRVYKMKRAKGDIIPKKEGTNSKDWQAIDLGNIILHIFSKEARQLYDLDSLWALGPQLDLEYNKKDPLVEMLQQNTLYVDNKVAS